MIISIFKGFCCFTWLEDLEVQGVLLFPLIPDTFGQSRALHARDEVCATVFERRFHLGRLAKAWPGPSDDDDDDHLNSFPLCTCRSNLILTAA